MSPSQVLAPKPSGDRTLWAWAKDHLALVVAGGPILLAILRVGRVAEFDPTTGYTLLQHGSPFAILGSVVLDRASMLVTIGTAALWLAWTRDVKYWMLRLFGAVFVLSTLLYWPLASIAAVAVVALLTAIPFVLGQRIGVPFEFDWRSSAFAVLVVWPLLSLGMAAAPWLPAERLGLVSGETRIGYVVARQGDVTTFLENHPRRMLLIPTDTIASRTLCSLDTAFPSASRVTLARVLSHESVEPTPPCD